MVFCVPKFYWTEKEIFTFLEKSWPARIEVLLSWFGGGGAMLLVWLGAEIILNLATNNFSSLISTCQGLARRGVLSRLQISSSCILKSKYLRYFSNSKQRFCAFNLRQLVLIHILLSTSLENSFFNLLYVERNHFMFRTLVILNWNKPAKFSRKNLKFFSTRQELGCEMLKQEKQCCTGSSLTWINLTFRVDLL